MCLEDSFPQPHSHTHSDKVGPEIRKKAGRAISQEPPMFSIHAQPNLPQPLYPQMYPSSNRGHFTITHECPTPLIPTPNPSAMEASTQWLPHPAITP